MTKRCTVIRKTESLPDVALSLERNGENRMLIGIRTIKTC